MFKVLPDADDRPFGMQYGQIQCRPEKITHNSGWYNGAGEELGFGDLSDENALTLCRELEDGDLFVVLSEEDTARYTTTPGPEYVADRCMMVIALGRMFKVDCYGEMPPGKRALGRAIFETITKEEARALILEGRVPSPR
jgi:hypothetical protein